MNITNPFVIPPLSVFENLILPILQQINPKCIVEVGSGKGELTEKLLAHIETVQGELICIDPYTSDNLIKPLASSSSRISLHTKSIEQVLSSIKDADLYLFNGDLNYYAVLQELELSWNLNQKANKPYFAAVRGVSWPFADRDAYYNPAHIPKEFLQPFTWAQGVIPESSYTDIEGGKLQNLAFALQAGCECNGVLAGIWKFLADKKEELYLINIPVFFGVGFLFSKKASWSEKLYHYLKEVQKNDLLIPMEESNLEIWEEICRFQQTSDWEETNRQNNGFDIENFLQKIQSGKGKKEGLGLVSIIIPTYNRPRLLVEAIRSCLNQTYRDIEIIVINDAGPDVGSVIESLHDDRIRYIHKEINQGVASARNAGVQQARGSYIAYLDDDDLYLPQHIELLVNALKDSGFSVAHSDYFRVTREEENGKTVINGKRIIHSYPVDENFVLIKCPVAILSVIHLKSCVDSVEPFDPSLRQGEDWDLWIRLAQEYPFLRIPIPTAEYTQTHGYSQTITGWGLLTLSYVLEIHRRYSFLVKDKKGIQVEQSHYRAWHWNWVFDQMKYLSHEEVLRLNPQKVLPKILENSQALSPLDAQNAQALLHYINQIKVTRPSRP